MLPPPRSHPFHTRIGGCAVAAHIPMLLRIANNEMGEPHGHHPTSMTLMPRTQPHKHTKGTMNCNKLWEKTIRSMNHVPHIHRNTHRENDIDRPNSIPATRLNAQLTPRYWKMATPKTSSKNAPTRRPTYPTTVRHYRILQINNRCTTCTPHSLPNKHSTLDSTYHHTRPAQQHKPNPITTNTTYRPPSPTPPTHPPTHTNTGTASPAKLILQYH
jgi:hypothetical protein